MCSSSQTVERMGPRPGGREVGAALNSIPRTAAHLGCSLALQKIRKGGGEGRRERIKISHLLLLTDKNKCLLIQFPFPCRTAEGPHRCPDTSA